MSLLLAFQGTTPAEPDYIIEVLSEVPEELEEDIGSTFLLIEDDYISSLESSVDEEEILEGFISELIEDVVDDEVISYLESSLDEEEPFEGFTLDGLIEDDIPPEPLEYLLFISDEGEEELIVPDGWDITTHSPFDDEPPVVVDIAVRLNLPFIVTPGRLRSFC
jgi:hypothetical protein